MYDKSSEDKERKMRFYNMYLNSILENPLLKSSEIVEFFLLKNDKMDLLKEKYSLEGGPVSLANFKSFTGTLDSTYHPYKLKVCQKMNKEIETKEKLYSTLNTCLRDVINSLDLLSNQMKKLSDAFQNLSEEYSKNVEFSKDSAILQFLKTNSIRYMEKYTKRSLLYEKRIKEFFSFINFEYKEMKYLYEDYINAKKDNDNADSKLTSFLKKESNKQKQDYEILKSELEKDLKDMNKKYFFVQNRVYDEFKRMKETHSNRIKQSFVDDKDFLKDID